MTRGAPTRSDPDIAAIEAADDEILPELDERWDRLAAGRLSEAERADLEGQAAESPLAAQALALFQPLPEALHERLIASALAGFDKSEPEPEPPRPRGRWRTWGVAGAFVGACAVLVLVLTRTTPGVANYGIAWKDPPTGVLGPSAPIETEGCATRSSDAPRFDAGDRLRLRLRPPTEQKAPRVRARVDGQPAALEVESSARGVITVQGEIGMPPLALAPGWHCVTVDLGGAFGSATNSLEAGFWVK